MTIHLWSMPGVVKHPQVIGTPWGSGGRFCQWALHLQVNCIDLKWMVGYQHISPIWTPWLREESGKFLTRFRFDNIFKTLLLKSYISQKFCRKSSFKRYLFFSYFYEFFNHIFFFTLEYGYLLKKSWYLAKSKYVIKSWVILEWSMISWYNWNRKAITVSATLSLGCG